MSQLGLLRAVSYLTSPALNTIRPDREWCHYCCWLSVGLCQRASPMPLGMAFMVVAYAAFLKWCCKTNMGLIPLPLG